MDDRSMYTFDFRNEERSWTLRRDRILTLVKQNRVHGRRAEIALKYFDKLRCCTRLESAIDQVNSYKGFEIMDLTPTPSSHVKALQMAKDVRRYIAHIADRDFLKLGGEKGEGPPVAVTDYSV